MKKEEFLTGVAEGLAGLPQEDIDRWLDYYREMLDDRIEDGIPEESAVAMMGTPDEVAKTIIAETPLPRLIKARVEPVRHKPAWVIVLLVLGAMFTSFWSIGFAFSDVVSCRFKRSTQLSWLITTLPAALIAVLVPLSVLDYVQIGAGALSLIFLLVVFPAYLHAVKDPIQPLLLGKLSGKRGLIAFVVIGTVLMAAASLIPIS